MNRYVVIMAGGIGSRFWPSSTEETPKQFLDILGQGESLIRTTYNRCLKLTQNENIIVITNKRYKDLVAEHLPELPTENILGEPSMNNTAPTVAWAALHIQTRNADATFAVLPSDHIIEKEDVFVQKMNLAFEIAAKHPVLITLGIQPTRPDTGYGYIAFGQEEYRGAKKVLSFKEKPDLTTAELYLSQGNYAWNAGMFIWHVSTIIKAYERHASQILEVLSEEAQRFGTAQETAYIEEVYPKTEKISVDYAILEKSQNVHMIPADMAWSDLGTWASLHAFSDKDQQNNVCQMEHGIIEDVADSIIRVPDDKSIIIKGLKNYIIVDEPHALLIYPKDEEQQIKPLVKRLGQNKD